MPARIQRKRTKGWRMPPGAVYVGRGTEFGNPFTLAEASEFHSFMMLPDHETPREIVVDWYESWLAGDDVDRADVKPPSPERIALLRGKDLVCWCPLDKPCHADVLLALANEDPELKPQQD